MGTLIAEFTVVGMPIPQGSARAFAGKGKAAGRAFLTNDPTGSIGKWRGDIRSQYQDGHAYPLAPTTQPVSVRLTFRFPRPKSHYLPANATRPDLLLRVDAPAYPIGGRTGDLDKLCRAVLDALTGICYVDDAQVVSIGATKGYADALQPGVDVRVSAL